MVSNQGVSPMNTLSVTEKMTRNTTTNPLQLNTHPPSYETTRKKTFIKICGPPVADITTGVNEPCSISRILCPYALLFEFSCFLQQADKELAAFDGANGLKTLTGTGHQQIHALTPPPESIHDNIQPGTNHESISCTLAVDREKSSCETGYNSGSVATCEHTSVNNVAVRSHISFCRIEGNPPLGQNKACLQQKNVLQAQCVGARSGSQQ